MRKIGEKLPSGSDRPIAGQSESTRDSGVSAGGETSIEALLKPFDGRAICQTKNKWSNRQQNKTERRGHVVHKKNDTKWTDDSDDWWNIWREPEKKVESKKIVRGKLGAVSACCETKKNMRGNYSSDEDWYDGKEKTG